MDRVTHLNGWTFSQWAIAHAWFQARTGLKHHADLAGANNLLRDWHEKHSVPPGVFIVTSPDFAWASRLFERALQQMYKFDRQYRANLGQEKGAGDSSSPTP